MAQATDTSAKGNEDLFASFKAIDILSINR